MENERTQAWVKTAAALVAAFGLVFALAAWPPLAGPVVFAVDLFIWPLDGQQMLAAPETRVFIAISGGLMVGWGVTLWKLAAHLMPVDPAAVRSITMTGLYCWFAVDSLASVMAGVPVNAAANVSFLVLFLVAFGQWRAAHA
ncbi:hypothetical protein SAMN05877838_0916 [Hoeflea halophila]|uniref:Uncharacterized protein n=1 Tax=Hoeflea halophila TaxID=714899 RepID=A0A286HZI7_9HYPH|nr:hypothetical protein [Hoeflea halophila]SOE13147.1 hypothetical protein SAMN05877838_0916 [Hoeflea halophila]